jgi:hypothetical protein
LKVIGTGGFGSSAAWAMDSRERAENRKKIRGFICFFIVLRIRTRRRRGKKESNTRGDWVFNRMCQGVF